MHTLRAAILMSALVFRGRQPLCGPADPEHQCAFRPGSRRLPAWARHGAVQGCRAQPLPRTQACAGSSRRSRLWLLSDDSAAVVAPPRHSRGAERSNLVRRWHAGCQVAAHGRQPVAVGGFALRRLRCRTDAVSPIASRTESTVACRHLAVALRRNPRGWNRGAGPAVELGVIRDGAAFPRNGPHRSVFLDRAVLRRDRCDSTAPRISEHWAGRCRRPDGIWRVASSDRTARARAHARSVGARA